ncbi:MAG: hypothetical protein ACOVS5_13120 [Oligoflexus sp.]
MSQFRSMALPGLLAVATTAALWHSYPQRVAQLRTSYDPLATPPLSDMHPTLINIFTLGHKNIYDDFINIWLLQIIIDSDRKHNPDELMRTIRAVIRHQPKLETIYMLSCFVMFQDYKRPEYCQEIILAGLGAFPQSWRLPMTQAFVHYFLLKEPAQAASFFMMAASRPQSPPYVQRLVQKLLKENTLAPEDVERSLDIMGFIGSGDQFKKMLETFGKMNVEQNQPRE